jgi:hypothetical protein
MGMRITRKITFPLLSRTTITNFRTRLSDLAARPRIDRQHAIRLTPGHHQKFNPILCHARTLWEFAKSVSFKLCTTQSVNQQASETSWQLHPQTLLLHTD